VQFPSPQPRIKVTSDNGPYAGARVRISYTGDFRIKFQQYDNYYITSDGFAFDDIEVY